MKRLTSRNENGKAYFPHCFREDTCGGMGSGDCVACEFTVKICNTLAKYEDMLSETDTESVQKDFNAAADAVLEYVCENLCKIPVNKAYTENDIKMFCNKCKLVKRVKSLKDAHMKFCDNVDKLYFEKCLEVNRLTNSFEDVPNIK